MILLDDGEADVRVTALEAISHLGLEPKVMLPTLVKTLHDEDAEVRRRALRVTRQLGRSAILLVPEIIPLTANEEERRSVARVLEQLERFGTDPSSIASLTVLLYADDENVRRLAARFLGLAGAAAVDTVPQLQTLLKDSDQETRTEAAAAIAKIQANQTTPSANQR